MATTGRARKSAARGSAARRRPVRTTRPVTKRRALVPDAVDAPRELEQGLRDDRAARDAYQAMPPSHRRAYVEFVEEAKRPETRVRRVQQALRMMAQWGAERAKRGAKRR